MLGMQAVGSNNQAYMRATSLQSTTLACRLTTPPDCKICLWRSWWEICLGAWRTTGSLPLLSGKPHVRLSLHALNTAGRICEIEGL